jgi:hypothetical protein
VTRALTITGLGLDFPHAIQAVRILRHRTDLKAGTVSRQTVYAITDPISHEASDRIVHLEHHPFLRPATRPPPAGVSDRFGVPLSARARESHFPRPHQPLASFGGQALRTSSVGIPRHPSGRRNLAGRPIAPLRGRPAHRATAWRAGQGAIDTVLEGNACTHRRSSSTAPGANIADVTAHRYAPVGRATGTERSSRRGWAYGDPALPTAPVNAGVRRANGAVMPEICSENVDRAQRASTHGNRQAPARWREVAARRHPRRPAGIRRQHTGRGRRGPSVGMTQRTLAAMLAGSGA